MSEKNFQKALIHLYSNIDRYDTYSEATFERFALSAPETEWLKELMTWQRDGLLLFNQQLRSKQRRFITQALPKSRDIVGRQLEALLDAYEYGPAPEGARHPADAVRSFADYAGAQVDAQRFPSKEMEFIRFEAVYASLALRPASTNVNAARPVRVSGDLRLSLDGDAAFISCTYDASAVMRNPSSLEVSLRVLKPCSFLLFQAQSGKVRTFIVAQGLARVLKMLRKGLSLGEVLEGLERAPQKAASASIERLLSFGAPFFSQDGSGNRF